MTRGIVSPHEQLHSAYRVGGRRRPRDSHHPCDLSGLSRYPSARGGLRGGLFASIGASQPACAPDVVLLDVNLGSEDGFSIARRLRLSWSGGLIMLTGRGDTIDRVVGLEIGADDYVANPFDLRELLARIRSVSRRSSQNKSTETTVAHRPSTANIHYYFDGFTLVLETRELRNVRGEIIALTTGEFNLLAALVEHSGRVQSRDALLQLTHNREAGPLDRTIDVQIGRLRKKLGDVTNPPKVIKSVRGLGYLFAPEVRKGN